MATVMGTQALEQTPGREAHLVEALRAPVAKGQDPAGLQMALQAARQRVELVRPQQVGAAETTERAGRRP